jgi:ketosteroid isomerase-like protein
MELWEIEARECIRDLVARYNANGDSGRIDQMMALFAEEAVMLIPPSGEYVGRKAIRAFLGSVAKGTASNANRDDGGVRFIRHFTATHQIDVLDREKAVGRSYFAVLTDRGLDHWGRYVDEYRRIDDRWQFWHRTCTTDGQVEDSWASRTPA